jgi:hypothetical protein
MTAGSNSSAPKKRGPPAFQMYAPDRLADRNFKAMSVAERGLLHTIELECWVNGSVPADKRELARTLSLDLPEVESSLTSRVWRYLEQQEGQDVIVCPELVDYRKYLDTRRASMSSGGRRGADNRWKGKRSGIPPNGEANGDATATLRGEELKGEERKGEFFKDEQSLENREWLNQYEGPASFEETPSHSGVGRAQNN